MYVIELLIITVIACSLLAWFKPDLQEKLLLDPKAIRDDREGYRLITHAFVHGSVLHLVLNVNALKGFGQAFVHQHVTSPQQDLHFLLLFLGGVLFSGIMSCFQYDKNPNFRAVGASAGILSIVMATTLAEPTENVSILGVGKIPAWVGMLILLGVDFFLRNKETGIGHKAHLSGAFYGLLFALYLNPKVLLEAWEKIIG